MSTVEAGTPEIPKALADREEEHPTVILILTLAVAPSIEVITNVYVNVFAVVVTG